MRCFCHRSRTLVSPSTNTVTEFAPPDPPPHPASAVPAAISRTPTTPRDLITEPPREIDFLDPNDGRRVTNWCQPVTQRQSSAKPPARPHPPPPHPTVIMAIETLEPRFKGLDGHDHQSNRLLRGVQVVAGPRDDVVR